MIQNFNIAVLNYKSFGLEKIALAGKMDSYDEKLLKSIENVINDAKENMKTAPRSYPDDTLPKVNIFLYAF